MIMTTGITTIMTTTMTTADHRTPPRARSITAPAWPACTCRG